MSDIISPVVQSFDIDPESPVTSNQRVAIKHSVEDAAVGSSNDPFLVMFDEPFDKDNPKDWPTVKKWTVTDVLSATGFNRIMLSTIIAPAITTIALDLHMSNMESVMALSVYVLATAFGPLLIGPLSEIYGREPILHLSNIWFLVFNLVCGFANSKQLLIAARFLAGFGASAIYALAGGVLGDIWRPEQRGKTLGMYILIPVMGAAVGPIIGGFMADRTTWRWIFWATSAFQFVMTIVSFLAFHETYSPVVLRKKAKRLREETGDHRYHAATQLVDNTSRSQYRAAICLALSRPLRLLTFHPLIQIVAVLSGLGYGTLYIVLATFASLWTEQYHQRVDISGLHYLAPAIGEIAGSQIGGRLMDQVFARLKKHYRSQDMPEWHVPLMLPGAIVTPIGLLLYGWAAAYRVHWVVVDLGVFLFCFGNQIFEQAISAYIIDAYPNCTSSASAAEQFVRSMTAFAFPLFATRMHASLGYGWTNSVVAVVSLLLMAPTPFVLWRYGPGLRAKAGAIS